LFLTTGAVDALRQVRMADERVYEVIQKGSGWLLRRQDRTPLVEFPTRGQAVRAGIAVCQDEGMTRLLIRPANGRIEQIYPLLGAVGTLEA
jgi:hypothetical protein